MRHDAVKEAIAEILREICKDVTVEPHLLSVKGQSLNSGANLSDGARLDISAVGLWQRMEKVFIDVQVFNPNAKTNVEMGEISKMYSNHEENKKKLYNQRVIQVEKGTFCPAIFSCNGGASKETSKLLKQIAGKLAEKRGEEYSVTIGFIRKRIAFDILKSCLISLRGTRGKKNQQKINELDLGQHRMEYQPLV